MGVFFSFLFSSFSRRVRVRSRADAIPSPAAAISQEPEKFEAHFSKYLAEDFDPTELEDNMDAVLEAIRENPVHEKKARSKPADAKSWKPKKLTYDERKAALKKKLEAIVASA